MEKVDLEVLIDSPLTLVVARVVVNCIKVEGKAFSTLIIIMDPCIEVSITFNGD